MRGGWLVGLAGVLVLAYITVNSVRTEGVGSRGPAVGEQLPPFAAPLVRTGLEGDANVARDACEVRRPGVLNVCELAADGPVVLAFVFAGVGECERQVDVLERVAPRFPGVRFAAIGVGRDRAELRHWGIPVGHDSDGAVASVYGVVVCPFLTFARQGGEVTGSSLSFLDEAALTRRVRGLR
ncbi:MAG TPA: hypothetical protein VD836_12270 [Solirubrobacteraceae bacterium]|nr:hypothetical protein [Solirubrobacteraceae bacterium]